MNQYCGFSEIVKTTMEVSIYDAKAVHLLYKIDERVKSLVSGTSVETLEVTPGILS